MPSKYRIRNYEQNSFYHIQNQGVGKSKIYLDDEDFEKFLYYIAVYLNPSPIDLPKRLLNKNLSSDVSLISYLLLPDHFHLLLHQNSSNGISKLIKQVVNGYTYYFNSKYKSSGPLLSGKYKSVKIPENNLANLVHFLHSHPGILWLADSLKSYPFSSHKQYLSTQSSFLGKEHILNGFSGIKDYEKWIESKIKDEDLEKNLLLD